MGISNGQLPEAFNNSVHIKDDKTEENTFEILQHSDRNINNS